MVPAKPLRKRKPQTPTLVTSTPKSKRLQNDNISVATPEQPRTKRSPKTNSPSVLKPIVVENIPMTRKQSKTPLKNDENREVDHIQRLRKRTGRHEYLVKWKNSDDDPEWVGRDIMASKYPESVIAFFQSIIVFK